MIQSSIRSEKSEVFTMPRKACRQGNTRSSSRAVVAFEKNKAADESEIFLLFNFFPFFSEAVGTFLEPPLEKQSTLRESL